MQFSELKINKEILRALDEEGYTHPTPIQQQAIPHALEGRDLLACAQTGTGKTAAFAIPIIQRLTEQPSMKRHRVIRSLILTPTRELAIQIEESFAAYGRHSQLKSAVLFGGVNQNSQVATLRRGVDILIATPGRLLDLIDQDHLSLSSVEILVLDEADRMLDMGFIHDMKKVLALVPDKRQSLFFSATLPDDIMRFANTILSKPVKVAVTPVSSTVELIRQEVYFVDKGNKIKLLLDILDDPQVDPVLVFTRTKHGADKVVRVLRKSGIHADAIHGNKAQNARQKALNNFKSGSTRVLVATDIAARGIDVDELAWVVNFDLPNIPETYVHRIGRTGRAGASGTAISFCNAEEKAYLRDIEKLTGIKVPVVGGHRWPLLDHDPEPTTQNRGSQGQRNKRGPRGRSSNDTRRNRSHSKAY